MVENWVLRFTDASLIACLDAAKNFASSGDDWHNHVIKPGCVHNPKPGQYILIIENNTTGEILGHVSEESPVETEKEIVRLRHGDDIIGGVPAKMPIGSEPEILKRARWLNGKDIDWHHHMMMPSCVLNPRPGKWLITLESSLSESIYEYETDEEPRLVLSEIEALFFNHESGSK